MHEGVHLGPCRGAGGAFNKGVHVGCLRGACRVQEGCLRAA